MQDGRNATLATVSLPPLPARQGGVARSGRGLAGVHRPPRPPTPPPRPESSLLQPPPPRPETQPPPVSSQVQSGPGRGTLPSPLGPHISLTQPRPGGQRLQNLYVDTPFKGGVAQVPARPGSVKRLVSGRQTVGKSQSLPLSSPPPPHSPVILKQPAATPCSILKTLPATPTSVVPDKQLAQNNNSSSSPASTDSIICTACGRCRCAACRTPRQLPQVWLCDNACLCSAESVLDTVTCMCCVKGVFYHCGKDGGEDVDEASCVDRPCSCSPNKRCLRWGCLAAMSLPLPCLLCYLPIRGVARGVESLYQRCTSQGCRCPAPLPASPSDSQKRLLG